MALMFLTPRQYFQSTQQRPRKRFGQHFLSQPGTAERIVDAAGLGPEDVVVEVGPGLGALTRFLVPRVKELHLVELDRDLAEYLTVQLGESSPHVTVHQRDVLLFELAELQQSLGTPLVVVGNLPYNISSPLVFRLLEALGAVDRAVFMVQKEVGDRLAAAPGSKDYGVLSVLLGVYAHVRPLFTVGPGQFYPPPKVDSLVLKIAFRTDPLASPSELGSIRSLVNAAFQQRRKTIANALKPLVKGSKELIDGILIEAGIDPMRRPETLSPEQYVRIAAALKTGQAE
ncbi:MAG: 16S rRNA (adenine(1518)-N(6)/adenine(1519)-N(6))-dimethyltransferase RsmA [Syntrophobacteraceae bacterium]